MGRLGGLEGFVYKGARRLAWPRKEIFKAAAERNMLETLRRGAQELLDRWTPFIEREARRLKIPPKRFLDPTFVFAHEPRIYGPKKSAITPLLYWLIDDREFVMFVKAAALYPINLPTKGHEYPILREVINGIVEVEDGVVVTQEGAALQTLGLLDDVSKAAKDVLISNAFREGIIRIY